MSGKVMGGQFGLLRSNVISWHAINLCCEGFQRALTLQCLHT